jgi:hypothetical protein
VRLADPARALTLRGYSADGALTLKINETAASPPKTLHLVVRKGQGEITDEASGAGVAKSEQQGATLALGLPTLGSIIAAGQRPSDAASLGLVQADATTVATADALFAGPRFQCLDPF